MKKSVDLDYEKKLKELFSVPKDESKKESKVITTISNEWEVLTVRKSLKSYQGVNKDIYGVTVAYTKLKKSSVLRVLVTIDESVLKRIKCPNGSKLMVAVNKSDPTILRLWVSAQGYKTMKVPRSNNAKISIPLGYRGIEERLNKENFSTNFVTFQVDDRFLTVNTLDIIKE